MVAANYSEPDMWGDEFIPDEPETAWHHPWEFQGLVESFWFHPDCARAHIGRTLRQAIDHFREAFARCGEEPLKAAERDRMLRYLAETHIEARLRLPFDYPKERIAAAMDSLAALTIHWGDNRAVRDGRRPDFLEDIEASITIFRNDMENLELAEGIKYRANRRRTAELRERRARRREMAGNVVRLPGAGMFE